MEILKIQKKDKKDYFATLEDCIENYIEKKKKKENISSEVKHIIKYSIKNILIINYNLINKFDKDTQDNNDPLYIKMEDNYGKILYVYITVEDNHIKINTMKIINNKKVLIVINGIEDFESYGFISMNIYKKNKNIYKIYSINDFNVMINDVRTIIFLKIIINIKNFDISEFDKNYKISLLEVFYIYYFLKGRRGKIIRDYFKITIKFNDKYNKDTCKNTKLKSSYILIKKKIQKLSI